MTVKTKDVSIKYTELAKKQKVVKAKKIYKIKNQQGKLEFKKVKVTKTGKRLSKKVDKAFSIFRKITV